MKRSIIAVNAFLLVFVLASCEKVVDLQVRGADTKYVIEGVLANEPWECMVKISRTLRLDENNRFDGVSGARVTITDDKGRSATLREASPGFYQSYYVGKPGTTYTMKVDIEGNSFTARSKMPSPVAIDSIYISLLDIFGEKTLIPNVVYQDPAEKGNAYRFIQYMNGVKATNIFLQDDLLSNGRLNTATLYQNDNGLKKGDTVFIDLLSIDKDVYKYWFSLYQGATGEDESASPGNPVSNIKGGALGYFSAHAVSHKSITVE